MTDAVPFPDPGQFAFAAELRSYWRTIHDEFRANEAALGPYLETALYDQGWQVLGLWNLPHREPLPDAAARFPRTAALVGRLAPSHGVVAFSVLAPGTHIHPHRGRPGPYLRCHLGLEVPQGDCAIRVAGASRGWGEGDLLVLDDRLEHEAWNRTPTRRVVLLFDFVP